jgi:cytochrome oxidase assembly protein ShyY1
MELGASAPAKEGFVVLRQNIDVADFGNEIKVPLVGTVQQTNDASDGLSRAWSVAISGADKNRGYAFQWFALSALALLLFAWFQVWKKIKHV